MDAAVDVILRLDEHLFALTAAYGPWIYVLLFAMVFAQTGLVVTPFLPGGSLLFAAGALCAAGLLDPIAMAAVLISAAVAGNIVNYRIGQSIGPRVFFATDDSTRFRRMLRREHLDRAHAFFERHGGKAVVFARFVPIVRTFVPFVAGAASMSYGAFAWYTVTGACVWVLSCFGLGFGLGNITVVRENFWTLALVLIAASLLAAVFGRVRARNRRRVLAPRVPAGDTQS